jgi:hypothetical protein
MLGKRQFSLGYLLLEIFWVGAALGLFRAAVAVDDSASQPLLLAGIGATGAAIGGLSGRMRIGAAVAVFLALAIDQLLPKVVA